MIFFNFIMWFFLLKLRSISKFQYKTWLSILPLCSGIHNLLLVWQVWAWRAIFQKWWILSKSVTSNKKTSIPQIWHNWNLMCFTHKKLRMSRPSIWYELQVSGQNGEFLVIFFPKGMILVSMDRKRPILPIFGRWLQKIVIFFVKISTLKWSAYPSSPFWYQLQVDRQCGSVVA